jgi:hypothetical protein
MALRVSFTSNAYKFHKTRRKLMKTVMLLVLALAVLIMPCALFAQQEKVTVTTTETTGTISDVKPDTIVVRTETSSSPTSYSYTKSTTYVDDKGSPVSIETVKSGMPVTVYYTREGDRMIANRVVVRKTTTTTTEHPTIEKKTSTTTTTTKP